MQHAFAEEMLRGLYKKYQRRSFLTSQQTRVFLLRARLCLYFRLLSQSERRYHLQKSIATDDFGFTTSKTMVSVSIGLRCSLKSPKVVTPLGNHMQYLA